MAKVRQILIVFLLTIGIFAFCQAKLRLIQINYMY